MLSLWRTTCTIKPGMSLKSGRRKAVPSLLFADEREAKVTSNEFASPWGAGAVTVLVIL